MTTRITALSSSLILGSVLAFGAGCGDGGDPDGEVSVNVLLGDEVAIGIPVIFHDSEGVVVAATTTDDNGRAMGVVPVGGMVTFATPAADSERLVPLYYTYTDVSPGDDLWFRGPASSLEVTSAAISAGQTPPLANASAYAYMACNTEVSASSRQQARRVAIRAGCVDERNEFDVVALAQNDDGAYLGYLHNKGVKVIPDAMTLNVAGQWKDDFLAVNLDMEDAQPRYADPGTIDIRSRVRLIGDRSRHAMPASVGIPGGELLYPDIGSDAMVTATASFFTGDTERLSLINRPAAEGVRIHTDDWVEPPRLAEVDTSGVRPSATWELSGSSHEVVFANADWNNLSWRVVLPPGSTSMVVPQLPERLSAPAGSLQTFQVSQSRVFDAGSWDEVRTSDRGGVLTTDSVGSQILSFE